MAILRRTSREVYRVYSEAEYLAGADEFGEWHRSQSSGGPRERPLRRLGAVAALTGALGALGGVIVFAGIGVRTSARDLAANGTSAKRGELLSPRRLHATPRARGDRARSAARMRRVPARARRAGGRSARGRRAVSPHAGVPAEPVGAMPVVADEATRADPAEHESSSPTQSEFGFER
jgi:hypothetical protein